MANVPVQTGRAGWIWFAGLALVLAGTSNLIQGLAAIAADEVLVGAPGNRVHNVLASCALVCRSRCPF
jgi:sensor domain CHASE-containing protein